MIRKMWGVCDRNKIHFIHDDKDVAENTRSTFGEKGTFLKQVWITDRDPFENVRKITDNYGDFVMITDAKILRQKLNEIIKASKQAIQNFDGRAG